MNNQQIKVKTYRQNKEIVIDIPIVKEKYNDSDAMQERFEVPCKDSFSVQYWNIEQLKNTHILKCEACKIITGISNAKKVSNDTVIRLFELGKYGYVGHSVKSENEKLFWNFGDLYAFRLSDGRIAYNSQARSVRAGLAIKSPPNLTNRLNDKGTVRIPIDRLMEIAHIDNGVNIDKFIEVIDITENMAYWSECLIRVRLYRSADYKYLLFGYDERAPYLAELPAPASTVQEAKDMLMPVLARTAIKNNLEVKRQGDIFFIELDDTMLQTPIIAEPREVLGTYESSHERSLPTEVLDNSVGININGVARDKETIKHTVKQYKRMPIYDTRHTATYRAKITLGTTDYQLVKGTIRHEGNQHKSINLDKWYIAVKNRAVVSHNVDPRSTQRFD